jgi:hypothetical protein
MLGATPRLAEGVSPRTFSPLSPHAGGFMGKRPGVRSESSRRRYADSGSTARPPTSTARPDGVGSVRSTDSAAPTATS